VRRSHPRRRANLRRTLRGSHSSLPGPDRDVKPSAERFTGGAGCPHLTTTCHRGVDSAGRLASFRLPSPGWPRGTRFACTRARRRQPRSSRVAARRRTPAGRAAFQPLPRAFRAVGRVGVPCGRIRVVRRMSRPLREPRKPQSLKRSADASLASEELIGGAWSTRRSRPRVFSRQSWGPSLSR
jgi:hypothetical protein